MIDPAQLADDIVEELAMPNGAADGLRALERGLLLAKLLTIALSAGDADKILPDPLARILHLLVATLTRMEPQAAEGLLGTPRAMAWLSRLARALDDSTRQLDTLQTLLEPSPMLLAAVWPDPSLACSFSLAPQASTAPFGSDWLLRNNSLAPLKLRVVAGGGRLKFLDDFGSVVASLGEHAECPSSFMKLEPARHFSTLGMQLLAAADYPELAGRRGPGESSSLLAPENVEGELSAALQVVAQVWLDARHAIERTARGVLPISMVRSNWNSASTGQLPYVVQLTVREGGSPILLAESLIHECSHVRLDMAMAVAPLLDDNGEKKFFHPWRPDPRPITGVLLGAHAFLAVLELYRRAQHVFSNDPMIDREIEMRASEVGTALELLQNAPFTPLGERIFSVLKRRYFEPAYGR